MQNSYLFPAPTSCSSASEFTLPKNLTTHSVVTASTSSSAEAILGPQQAKTWGKVRSPVPMEVAARLRAVEKGVPDEFAGWHMGILPCTKSHTLHGTAIYAAPLTPQTTPGQIGICMAVLWSVWE